MPRLHRLDVVPRSFTVLIALAAAACGGDSGPLDPGQLPALDVTGTWYSANETGAGVPLSRYDLTQNGSTLTGEAFWVWGGALERIGTVAGSIDPDGSTRWTTTLNDNGWDGTETIEGRFTGVEADTPSPGAGSVSGSWEWRSPDGSLRDGGSFRLNRPETVDLSPGTGSLGVAGPWRGSMLYSSAGDCHTTGFLMTMALSVDGGAVTGTVSGKPHPRGAALPTTLPGWLGYMHSSVSGYLLRSGDRVTLSLELQGDVNGLLDGDLIQGDGATQYLGVFQGAKRCEDARGGSDAGYFVFNSERPVVY